MEKEKDRLDGLVEYKDKPKAVFHLCDPMAEEVKPIFGPNMAIKERSLVSDKNGVLWWVDPPSMKIMRA